MLDSLCRGSSRCPSCRSRCAAELSGWICEAEHFFGACQLSGRFAAAGRQKLSGKFRRPATAGKHLLSFVPDGIGAIAVADAISVEDSHSCFSRVADLITKLWG